MDDLGRRRDRLSLAQRELLDRRLRGACSPAAKVTIPKRPETGPCPLSFRQEGLWFLERLHPGLCAYNLPVAIRLRGRLDLDALRRSLETVVVRHEALRTRFISESGRPYQIVHPVPTLTFNIQEMAEVPPAGRMAEAIRRAEDDARLPFELEGALLWRATCYRLDEGDHVFSLLFHHAIFDGWSTTVLLKELAQAYAALAQGEEPEFDALPTQPTDHAAWERLRCETGGYAREAEFWKNKLEGLPPALGLAGPFSESRRPSFRGAQALDTLSPALSGRLAALCAEEKTTLFQVLLAAWAGLLSRLCGEEDLIVGSVSAGRARPELHQPIGYFANTIPLRFSVSAGRPFRELVGQAKETVLEALEHQDLPFERIVAIAGGDRSPDTAPFFRSMLDVQAAPASGVHFPGLRVEPLDVYNGSAKFDISLSAREFQGGIALTLEYDVEAVSKEMASRLLRHFRVLLQDGLDHPDLPLHRLQLVSEEERHHLVAACNDTARAYPRDRRIEEIFAERVRLDPSAPAATYGDRTVAYSELAADADRIAGNLLSLGVRPGSVVAVRMERSIPMLAAYLGILKARCAYMPVDADVPQQRLGHILESARPALLLADTSLVEDGLPASVAVATLEPDLRIRLVHGAIGNDAPAVGDDIACVIFTSGTTGGPKGICIPHKGILRLVVNADYVEFPRRGRVGQISNVGFDAAIFEIWGALLNGACVVGIPRHVALSPSDLVKQLAETPLDILLVTTAFLNRMAIQMPDIFRDVGTLLFGGEAASAEAVGRILRHGPPRRLLHAYGPAECTTLATVYPVERIEPEAVSVPIGRPIGNTQVHVLDRWMQPVPAGFVGELYLGGDGLAQGYLHDPDLTRERFLPNPFTDVPDARLYRTGDFARRRPDGNLEFLGRQDDEVKLRGFRFRLGEIEAVLCQHPQVAGAAAAVWERPPHHRAIVAYCVPFEGQEIHADGLRTLLRSRLPEYMVPSLFIRLSQLPLTPNGKLDRRSLPPPKGQPAEQGETAEAHLSSTERDLARLWEGLLGIDHIGRRDSFFDIGGHSLLAMEVIAGVRDGFGVSVTLRDVLENATLEALARRIDLASAGAASPGEGADPRHGDASPYLMVPVRASGSRRPFFFVTGAGDVIGSYGTLVSLLDPDQPFYGFAGMQRLSPSDEFPDISELARMQVEELRSVQSSGPYRIGGYSFGAVVAFEMAQQLTRGGEVVEILVIVDTGAGIAGAWSPAHAWRAAVSLPARLGRKVAMVWRTLPALYGYARDALTLLHRGERRDDECGGHITLREFLRWVWHDAPNQYLMKSAGVLPRLGASRLRVAREPHVQSHIRYVHAAKRALRTYRFQPYSGRVTLIRTLHDPLHFAGCDRTLGWRRIAGAGVEVRTVPGNHMVLFRKPQVVDLARELQEALNGLEK